MQELERIKKERHAEEERKERQAHEEAEKKRPDCHINAQVTPFTQWSRHLVGVHSVSQR